MQTVPVHVLREQWARFLDGADFRGEVVGVARHGRVDVLLVPVPVWRAGCARVPVASVRRAVTAGDARERVRELREDARAGTHTVITRYGQEIAVLVPHEWATSAGLV
ncbi:hypothetical protein JK358_38260 [Nocardia sp. 2]|uniref:Antitoxin n=1 Tax=Nocardia acididurans TaxID=2802282 RepID=A0ABS1MJ05_9NOCA|nr:hypothetical protein [Nocardia acididurans]MBL1080256.1 hypothetical protein [Nocardia acididurans]